MKLGLIGSILLASLAPVAPSANRAVYLVHDDPAPMEALASGLRSYGLEVQLLDQQAFKGLKEQKSAAAIFMYIHGTFDPEVERRLIRYTEDGGRLIVLHHGAASGKVAAKDWFPFLGLKILPTNAPDQAWNVLRGEFQLVNLNPGHYVTSHAVAYDRNITYAPSDSPSAQQQLPAIVLPETETFLNQLFTDGRKKTVLFGLKATADGRTYMQDRGGWILTAGKGHVFYLQPGHHPRDFEHPGYLQILVNAVRWQPGASVQRPVVAVDGFHNDEKELHYRWEGTYPGGFSELGALLTGLGAETRTVRELLTARSLAGVTCLIVADPDTPSEAATPKYLTNEEAVAVEKWVRAGGRLLLLGNNEGNAEFLHLNRLARRFKIEFLDGTVKKADGDGRLKLEVPASPRVFAGGSQFYAVDVAPLKVGKDVRVLLRHGETPILAMTDFGLGTVVALGDPWVYNEYIDSANNRRLVSELFRYLLF